MTLKGFLGEGDLMFVVSLKGSSCFFSVPKKPECLEKQGFAFWLEPNALLMGDLKGPSDTLTFSISSVQKKGSLLALLVMPSPALKTGSSSFLA
jgi:hypothetical protein